MNPIRLYSLRPLALTLLSLLLLSAVPVYAQSTPTATPTATLTPTRPAPPNATATTAGLIAPMATTTAAPLPTLPPATPTPPATGGSDRLVPLLLGGLFLLAGLAIGALLLLRRRQPRPPVVVPTAPARPVAPVVAPSATSHPPALDETPTMPLLRVDAEAVTQPLTRVYLQLEGDGPRRFTISETPFAIGRDPANNLPIDETFPGWRTVSRHHALISRHARGYVIEDLGSPNGVRVNGRLTPKNLLRSGWQVSIGGVTLRFVDETENN